MWGLWVIIFLLICIVWAVLDDRDEERDRNFDMQLELDLLQDQVDQLMRDRDKS